MPGQVRGRGNDHGAGARALPRVLFPDTSPGTWHLPPATVGSRPAWRARCPIACPNAAESVRDVELKPIHQQTIVITGASSGIGLVTAKEAARRGASVVLVARGEEGLARAVDEIRADGGEAIHIVADVAKAEDMERVADTVLREYEGFDAWVNNASVSIYGRLDEILLEDKRQLFEVNFWGVVNGCRAALPHLRQRGGVLLNVGSCLSDRAAPLLGIYSASKHAVKAYTDALRMELEAEDAPVAVTLVTPSSIDTPFFEHAKNYMTEAPKPFPPVYAPEVVADTILECLTRPVRDITVGGGGKMISVLGRYAPRVADKVLEKTGFDSQTYDDKAIVGTHNLYEPRPGSEHGRYDGHVMQSSLYTKLALVPRETMVLALGAAGALLGLARLARDRRIERQAALGTRPSTLGFDREVSRTVSPAADSAEGMAHVPSADDRANLTNSAELWAQRTAEHETGSGTGGAKVYGWGTGPAAR